MQDLPHFTYHPKLRVLRLNGCQLRFLHPLALVGLPALETIHLADNLLESLPELFLQRSTELRVLNLARNRIADVNDLEWSLPMGLVLEQLVLDSNPIERSMEGESKFAWPLTRQLHLAGTGLEIIRAEEFTFGRATRKLFPPNSSNTHSIILTNKHWKVMELLDLSENPNLVIHSSALAKFSNLTSLKLRRVNIQQEFLQWINAPTTNCRHLDLHSANLQFSQPSHWSRQWTFCSSNLEWLDISNTQLDSLQLLQTYCRVRWLFANNNYLNSVNLQGNTLQTLELDNNRLEEWPLGSGLKQGTEENHQFHSIYQVFKHLEVLSLANNSIEVLPRNWLNLLPQLQHLDLSRNRLLSVFAGQTDSSATDGKLRFLNLSGNSIRSFPGYNTPLFPSLTVVDISSNGLEDLDTDLFSKYPSLQHLHLSKNPNIELQQLVNLPNLVHLDINECDLKEIPDFSQLAPEELPACVVELVLRENQLQDVGRFSEKQLKCLKELDLGVNPLECDCSLMTLDNVLKQQANFYDRTEYYCFIDNWQHSLGTYLESNSQLCEYQKGTEKAV
uniref:Toll-like receptor 3 n=1 Tax=Ditylenchus dipsaci TaxID=166011 RepID=A0A915CQ09_9BILA